MSNVFSFYTLIFLNTGKVKNVAASILMKLNNQETLKQIAWVIYQKLYLSDVSISDMRSRIKKARDVEYLYYFSLLIEGGYEFNEKQKIEYRDIVDMFTIDFLQSDDIVFFNKGFYDYKQNFIPVKNSFPSLINPGTCTLFQSYPFPLHSEEANKALKISIELQKNIFIEHDVRLRRSHRSYINYFINRKTQEAKIHLKK